MEPDLCYKLIPFLIESQENKNKEQVTQTLHDSLVKPLLVCLKKTEATYKDGDNSRDAFTEWASAYAILVQLSVVCPLGKQLTSSVFHNWQEGLSQIADEIMKLMPRPHRVTMSFKAIKTVYGVCVSKCVEGTSIPRSAWLCRTTLNAVAGLVHRDLCQLNEEGCLNKAENKEFELVVSWLEASILVHGDTYKMAACLDEQTVPLLLLMLKRTLSKFNESLTSELSDTKCYKSWHAMEKLLHARQQRVFELYKKSNGSLRNSLQLLYEWLQSCHNLLVDRIEAYHTSICKNVILHDKDSHDWTSSHPLFKGDTISFHIQMWQFHMMGLLYDLWRDPSPVAAIRVLRRVLVETVYCMTQYYTVLSPTSSHIQRYKGDVMAILVTVSFLLPYIDDHPTVSPNLSLLHSSCVRLLHCAAVRACPTSVAGDEPLTTDAPIWQKCLVPLISRCGFYSHDDDDIVGLIQTIVSQPEPPWMLLVKVLLENNGGLSVQLCHSRCGLIRDVAQILSYCYHQPHLLSDVFQCLNIRIGCKDDLSRDAVKWLKDYLTLLLEKPVLYSLIEFVIKQKHASGIKLSIHKLLDQLYLSLKSLQSNPTLWPLLHRILGQCEESYVSEFLSEVLHDMLKSSDSVAVSMLHTKSICEKYSNLLQQLFTQPVQETESQVADAITSIIWSSDISEKVKKILRIFADTPSIDGISCKTELSDCDVHGIAADLALSEQRGRDSLDNIYNWIKRNTNLVMKYYKSEACGWMARDDLYPYEMYITFFKNHRHLLLEVELNWTEILQKISIKKDLN